MRLGVHLVNFTLPGGPRSIGPTLAATGAAAEEAGLECRCCSPGCLDRRNRPAPSDETRRVLQHNCG
jgi:hypothetical protein